MTDVVDAPPTSEDAGEGGGRWPPPSYWARTTIAIGAVVVGAVVLYELRSLAVLVILALILAVGLQRPIDWLERRHVSRGAALAIIVTTVVVVIGGFLALVVPSILRQTLDLAGRAPKYLDDLQRQPWVKRLDKSFDVSSKLEDLGSSLPDQALTIGSGILSGLVDGLTLLVLTLYFASDLPRLRRGVARLLLPHQRERFDVITGKVVVRVSGYVNGNLIISVIAGVTSFLTLLAFGVPYAAALAFWVALTDCIPTIGAFIGAAAALAVAITVSPTAVIGLLVFFVAYQAIENYVITPRVMRGAIDMSVGAVLIAVLAGGEILGVVGVLIALPIAAAARTVLDELYLDERKESVQRVERRLRRRRQRLGARHRLTLDEQG
ncbi:MAG: AI-2E family transporter [Acidimicrobiales bacterium]